MKKLLLLIVIAFAMIQTDAQYTTNKVVGKKNEALKDSLQAFDYPYMLPIWGKQVTKKGFNLPYSAGISVQYIWQKSDIVINNLQVGFNNGPLYNLDQIIRFDKSQATSNGVNVRADFWLLPFLNIYGIFAQSKTSTAIKAGVYVPDSSNTWNRILDINTKANFNGTTYGFGLTPTMGVGGFFLALDMNFTWTDIPELNKPAFAYVFGPRFGKNFVFKNKPQRNLAIWAGGFRVKINSGTTGSLNTSDLFPIDQWQKKIDTGYTKVAASQQKVDAWWDGLTPVEQKNPVNIAKHNTANAALATAGSILNAASGAVSTVGNSTVQYSLDKRQKDLWNFIVGGQFQINKSWMIRAEYGFLGSRMQFIGGLQWRFGL
ncbi:MAG: hypothetical protein C5B59_00385 [Bacteroidetes bacterium]|nr:MAG: hypothetical protein C5B59_00385 [Bacteroidota bacterium]